MRVFWQYAQTFPPVACRLLARTEGRAPRVLTDTEIAARSGLPMSTIVGLSRLTSWNGVPVEIMRQFIQACGMDFASANDMRRARQYMEKGLLTRLGYLKRSEEWETRWKPMVKLWMSSIQSKS